MKKEGLWRGVFCLGLLPLLAPFALGIYHAHIESWQVMDWVVLYSFLYWPTYLIGLGLMLFAIVKLKKSK